jgi:hypothetical protein
VCSKHAPHCFRVDVLNPAKVHGMLDPITKLILNPGSDHDRERWIAALIAAGAHGAV